MVDNIQEIEPVIKKEAVVPHEEIADNQEDDDSSPPLAHDDPAQMKLEL